MTSRLPTGAAFRPTKMQLMLYHHFLSNLVADQVDFSLLLDRYSLKGDKPFSDSFIAQIGGLNNGITTDSLPDTTSNSSPFPSQDSMTLLLEHNSLRQLWSLMIRMFQAILPAGKDSIGNVLRTEYRSREHGDILGSSTLAMDDNVLQVYLDHEMKWWNGEREPLGVVIEEAYKCKSCEFADTCDWRRARISEATEKARASNKALLEVKKWEV
jgi:exonuclease V